MCQPLGPSTLAVMQASCYVISLWQLLVNLHGEQVGFLLDSRARTSLPSQGCYRHFCDRVVKVHLYETDNGLVHAGGELLQVYGEATLVLDLGGGLGILHAFLVADLAADSHLLGMDFLASYGVCIDQQASQLEAAGHSTRCSARENGLTTNQLI